MMPGEDHSNPERGPLEELTARKRELWAAHVWALRKIALECPEGAASQHISEVWRDCSLIMKRAARRYEQARAAARDALNGGTA